MEANMISLSPSHSPIPFLHFERWQRQANECFHLNTQTWLTAIWQPTIYVRLNSKREKKRNKDGKSFVQFFSSSELKPIRTCSLICEDFLMVIKWLRKKRNFFKLKRPWFVLHELLLLLLVEKSNQRFPCEETKMKWNQKFIKMFCCRVVQDKVWTTLLHKWPHCCMECF